MTALNLAISLSLFDIATYLIESDADFGIGDIYYFYIPRNYIQFITLLSTSQKRWWDY